MNDPVGEVLGKLRNVRKVGGDRWIASSPTRRDANPSLSIRRGEDGRCLLHDFGGSSVAEIAGAMGMAVTDLFSDERQGRGWVAQQPIKKAYRRPELPPDATYREGTIKWFAARGIGEETIKHFGIFGAEHYFHKLGKQGPAICFPYRKDGEIVNIKFRSPQVKDFAMTEDAEPIFFNLDSQHEGDEVIVVEGEGDVMALFEAGVTNAISPPNGCQSLTATVMDSAAHLLARDGTTVILAGDMDEPGEKMMEDLATRIGKDKCFRVRWPDGCKDANDTLMKYGAEKVRECVTVIEPYPVEGIITIDDIEERIWSLYIDGLPPGVSTGFSHLDPFYTVMPGYWTLVTGSPGSGKSTMLDQITVNLAEIHDWNFGICSLENPDTALHFSKLAAKHIRKPFGMGSRERMNAEELNDAIAWAKQHYAFIAPEEPSVESVLKGAKALVYRMGIKGLIIDPWNELEHPPSGLNNGDYISRSLSLIRQFAHHFNVHVWLVAHPTKLQKGANDKYPIPTMYDVAGSAHFFAKADFGVSIYIDEDEVQFHVQKTRHTHIARKGVVPFAFDLPTGRYFDPQTINSQEPGTIAEWHPVASAMDRNYAKEETWEAQHAVAD